MISPLLTLLTVGLVLTSALPTRRSNVTQSDNQLGTVYYTLELTNGPVSPAGVSRNAILINGQTPGPTLEIEEGQTLSINVINHLSEDSTLHLHGESIYRDLADSDRFGAW
jgi:FtsP/CotA-like multicopper oxidase with cupredoxin domain